MLSNGPLRTVWISAHLERRVTRKQVNEACVDDVVGAILFPEAPLALRISAYLMLGLARIYSRKVAYLLSDCNDALRSVKRLSIAPKSRDHSKVVTFAGFDPADNVDIDDVEPLSDREWCENSEDQHVVLAASITLEEHADAGDACFTQFELDERLPGRCYWAEIQPSFQLLKDPFPVSAGGSGHLTEANVFDTQNLPDADDICFEPRTPPPLDAAEICRFSDESISRPPVNRALAAVFELLEETGIDSVEKAAVAAPPTVSGKEMGQMDPNIRHLMAESHAPRTPHKRLHSSKRRKTFNCTFDATSVLPGAILYERLVERSDLLRPKRQAFPARDSSHFYKPLIPGMCDQLVEVYTKRLVRSANHCQRVFYKAVSDHEVSADRQVTANMEVVADWADREVVAGFEAEETPCPDVCSMPASQFPASDEASGTEARICSLGPYLKQVFQSKGCARLQLESCLSSKSAREAACAFFDLLVLKSKEYINVEQDSPFRDIHITPTPKLMEAQQL